MIHFLKEVLKNKPSGWLNITTHRLDIYNEKLAKTEFLEQFENLYAQNNSSTEALNNLPTAYDYIRLGHPLSCVLEWTIAKQNNTQASNIIGFSSKTIALLAILRKNSLENRNTQLLYTDNTIDVFDLEVLKSVYAYNFELKKINSNTDITEFKGTTVHISKQTEIGEFEVNSNIDFYIQIHENIGSILFINGAKNNSYTSDIQHVRRRETIAITPANAAIALNKIVNKTTLENANSGVKEDKKIVLEAINKVTGTLTKPLVASSGLSIQYAILMGLVHNAIEKHKGKAIKIIVPPNCYGGTNDQARRVAACIKNVTIEDLNVDGENDMVQSIETVLQKIALSDGVPLIIAEIPTNPRVEVPNLIDLKEALSKKRLTANGEKAIAPIFILDQTFCPNVPFVGETDILSDIKTISFVSGSKFPSGGKCTAGYCVGNNKSKELIDKIELHLQICDNEATPLQYKLLAEQLPSMNQRISDAYINTRDFVTFIKNELPNAKINFVSEELAQQGFTPSVFSLDLPTKGNNEQEREMYKRELNLKLINAMITQIPNESKFCVSYGQLKGCYWTIPATSTQGTTKEGDKDYIVRASLSGNMNMELHKKVFLEFIKSNF